MIHLYTILGHNPDHCCVLLPVLVGSADRYDLSYRGNIKHYWWRVLIYICIYIQYYIRILVVVGYSKPWVLISIECNYAIAILQYIFLFRTIYKYMTSLPQANSLSMDWHIYCNTTHVSEFDTTSGYRRQTAVSSMTFLSRAMFPSWWPAGFPCFQEVLCFLPD